MYNYIYKPKTINSSHFKNNEFALSPFNYRKTVFKNNNTYTLENLLNNKIYKGFEPGTTSYIGFSDNYFIRISDLDDLNLTFDITEDTKKIIPPSSDEDLINKYDILYQSASNEGNVCIYLGDKPAYYNSHLRKLLFNEDKFYIFALLKSNVGKQQVEVLGSIKGMDNFKENYLLNTVIPYPNKKNHEFPNKVKFLVSQITQNIINKEEQIKNKNLQIDELIEAEIKSNQKENLFSYEYPTINKIKYESRMDTVLYEKEYTSLEFLVLNYINDVFFLKPEHVSPGKTPKDYYFTSKKQNNTYLWVTPKNMARRQLLYNTYIYSSKPSNTKKHSLIFTGVRYVGNCFFVDNLSEPVYCNQNTLVINYSSNIIDQLYLLCYLSSNIGRNMQLMQRIKGIVPILYKADLVKIPIPNFPINIRTKLSRLYYNPVHKDNNIALEEYLAKEIDYNQQLGIYQLNMEILDLRNKLNELIDKIANEKPISIDINNFL